MLRTRELALLPLAALAGIAVAAIDSRPGWDDSGVTAALLAGAAFVVAAAAGRRPWLWALVVGAWTPAVEIPASGQLVSAVALLFAAIGALAGWGLTRLARRAEDEPRDRPAAPPT
jgi:hypothetical protein